MEQVNILLKSQKKKLWDIIQKEIGNTNGFELKIENATTIIYHKEGYYFKLMSHTSKNCFNVLFFPYNNTIQEHKVDITTFNGMFSWFSAWARGVKIELDCEDVWGQRYEQYKIGEGSRYSDKFTDEEQTKIKLEINNLKYELSQRDDLKDSLDQINIKLDLLGELVCDLSKTSWRDHVVGSVLGLAIDNITSEEVAQGIGSKLFSAIGHIWNSFLQ